MDRLSHDLRLMILEQVADIASLASVIFVSKSWYETFRSRIQWTLGNVLHTELGEGVFRKAVDYYYATNDIGETVAPQQFLQDAISRRKEISEWKTYLREPYKIDFEVMAGIQSAITILMEPTMDLWGKSKYHNTRSDSYETVFSCSYHFETIMGRWTYAPKLKELYGLYYLWLTLWTLQESVEVPCTGRKELGVNKNSGDDSHEVQVHLESESHDGAIVDMENISRGALDIAQDIISIDHSNSPLLRDIQRGTLMYDLFQLRHLWKMIPSDVFSWESEGPIQGSRGIFEGRQQRLLLNLDEFRYRHLENEPERHIMDRLKSKNLEERFKGLRHTMSEDCFILIALKPLLEQY